MAIKGGGTNVQQTLKGGGLAFLSQNETCFQCHSAQRGPFVFEHEAVRQGCVTCHSPHGSVNQRLLNERNQTLCLKCHFQEQKEPGHIFIGDVDHSSFLPQGTCWSAGCHEAIHGSQVNPLLRYGFRDMSASRFFVLGCAGSFAITAVRAGQSDGKTTSSTDE